MKLKTFEIRDRATFIPMLAIKLRSDEIAKDKYLLKRAGLDHDESYQIALIDLNSGNGHLDPHHWGTARTLPIAHQYIEKNFDELETGDVIDVQFILGETSIKEISEEEIHKDLCSGFNDDPKEETLGDICDDLCKEIDLIATGKFEPGTPIYALQQVLIQAAKTYREHK